MEWGFLGKEEVHAMIEERRTHDRRKIEADIAACNARHDAHDKHREDSDKTMKSFNDTITELTKALHTTNNTLSKWVELQPTVERTKNNFTTIDTLKSWGGSLAVLYVAYDIIKKLIG